MVSGTFAWSDGHWRGIPLHQYILYELHVGTFTPEGTFDAIIPHLEALVALGITAIELMPIAQFPGHRNWGYDGVDVAAPGGYFNDGFGTPTYKNLAKNTILAPMPRALALEDPLVDKETGESRMPLIVAECTGTTAATCSYYQYLQGTSMASPHAAGVAALIVGRWGKKRNAYDAITMAPKHVERILTRTATATPCPRPLFTYPDRSVEYNATCVGSVARNSWYGHGIVDALTAVTRRN